MIIRSAHGKRYFAGLCIFGLGVRYGLDIRRRLVDVLQRMELLCGQHEMLKFLRNQDHARLLDGLIQDISRTITDHQVCDRKRSIQC